MKYFQILIFICVLFCSLSISAQNTTKDTTLHLVERNDGVKYIAKILSDDGREVLLETQELGKLYILKSEIKRISIIEDLGEIKNGELREESPFSTRYAFTNNALPIKKNEHYAMVNLFGPEIHFAVSDRLNIGVMTSWIGSPLVAVAKFTIPTSNEKVNFSLASMFGTSGYLDGFESFGGLHWGTFTYGDRKNNISFSGGYGYLNVSGNSGFENVPGTYTYQSYDNSNILRRARPIPSAPIFSVAGIFQLTSKASIFFDSMFGSIRSSTSTDYVSDYIVNQQTGQGTYMTTATVTEGKRGAFIYFMPGMRFQQTERKAFQIAIAGVSLWQDGDNSTFPLPMISWFFKF